jgi:hypothetical protein
MVTPYVPLVLRENLEKVGNPRHKKSVGNKFVLAFTSPCQADTILSGH